MSKRKSLRIRSRRRRFQITGVCLGQGQYYEMGIPVIVNGISFVVSANNVEVSARELFLVNEGNKLIFHVKKPKAKKS